jgi:hypothetical protein
MTFQVIEGVRRKLKTSLSRLEQYKESLRTLFEFEEDIAKVEDKLCGRKDF